MEYKINQKEHETLRGLPHLQQLVYCVAIRPYMDYHTGIVGIKRRISHQSISEVLYVEPHPGYRSGSPSRNQIRRAIKGLEKAGLVEVKSNQKHLILKCFLASQDTCIQNKADIKPTSHSDHSNFAKTQYSQGFVITHRQNADALKNAEADIPPEDNNYYLFVKQQFENFWKSYPLKRSKAKAFEAFQRLKPDEKFLQKILNALAIQKQDYENKKSLGLWVPNWKYPATWLSHEAWNDEIEITPIKEKPYANKCKHYQASTPIDHLWESCAKSYNTHQTESNIIEFPNGRQSSKD